MAKYHFTATGFIDSGVDSEFHLRWEDGKLSGTFMARALVSDTIRAGIIDSVKEGNMRFYGDSMMKNPHGCKKLLRCLFYKVEFSDENLPPPPTYPEGSVA